MRTKTLIISSVLGILSSVNLSAQISDLGLFLAGGKDDATKVLSAYIKPYTNAFGYNLNAGWYNTAKVHSLLGFDVNFSINVSLIPAADKEFDLSKLGLTANIGSPSITPTIAGKKDPGPAITYTAAGRNLVSYNSPGGVNVGFIPTPMAQLGIGLIKGTEIIGRYVPEIKLGESGKLGLWGFGIKHSLKQWIPVIDELPFLNLSILGGYTKFHSTYNIDLDPTTGNIYSNVTFTPAALAIDYSDQELDLTVKSFTANAIISIDIPIITVYAGLGISSTNTDLKLFGNYPIPNPSNYNVNRFEVIGSTSGTKQDIYSDPINTQIKGGTKPRLNGGLKLKLGIIAFNFDYIYSNYSIVTAGIGIGFR